MTISLDVNGATFDYPQDGDGSWGPDATSWALAITNGTLQKQGGNFTLTADANFGANFGLLADYFSSRGTASSAGLVRLAVDDTIGFRNNANDGNLLIAIDGSDNLTFGGTAVSLSDHTHSTSQVTSGTFADARIAETNVTQHEGALSIAGSQLTSFTFDVPCFLVAGDNATVVLNEYASTAYTINAAYFRCASGTISFKVQIGGNDVTGLTALAVSSSQDNASASAANDVQVGEKVDLVFSSNSAATFVSIVLHCTRGV